MSPLESYVVAEKLEFNWEQDPSLLSEYQIRSITTPWNGFILKLCLKNTAARLCSETMLPDFILKAATDLQLLSACKRLLKLRTETLNIISHIHRREYLLLRIITDSASPNSSIQDDFMQTTFKIIALIKQWKRFNHSEQKFMYSSENYLEKIHKDLLFLESSLG
jgi:hypothetical protein